MSIKASAPKIARLNVFIFFTPVATSVLGETRLTVRSDVQSKHCASRAPKRGEAKFWAKYAKNALMSRSR
jgi:hypothetical protein